MFLTNPFIYATVTDFNLNAIDLNWTDEYMYNSTNNALWFWNTFTLEFNWKSTNAQDAQYLTEIRNSWSNANLIQVWMDTTTYKVQLFNSSGSVLKRYSYWNWNTAKHSLMVTRDWTNLLVYENNSAKIPTKETDNAWSMAATDRRVSIWNWNTASWWSSVNWVISTCRIWSVALDANNRAEIVTQWPNYDARNNVWNYNQSANLVHQWALWKDSTDASTIGTDYVASWWVNIWTNAVNISSADVVTY